MMKIELWPIDRPVPYAKNPRKIPQSAIDKVAASIKEFGWRQSIVVDAEGVIVVGHTRLLAARKLGLLEVPVHVAADLTEAQCRAYRITDNRAGEEARWDDGLLKLEIGELGALAELTAFDPKELTRLGLGRGRYTGRHSRATGKPCGAIRADLATGQASAHVWRFYAPGMRFKLDEFRKGSALCYGPTLRSRLLRRLASSHQGEPRQSQSR